MKSTQDLINLALSLVGRPYVLGSAVPKDDANYKSSFDCAEFVAYCNYQTFGILYGCLTDDIAKIKQADAYTGYFDRDAKALGRIITVAEAAQIQGAIILRVPKPGAIGHVVLSQGNGKTVEANCTKYGCIESVVTGRRFDYGILLDGVAYNKTNTNVISTPPKIVYRFTEPMMNDPFIKKLQKALNIKADGIFGEATSAAVAAYQKLQGLVSDGEVMPGGETATSLKL